MTKLEISVKTLLIAAGLFLLYLFFSRIEYVLILVMLAFIITAGINPIISALDKRGLKRGFSIFLIYFLISIGLLLLAVYVIYPLLRESIELIRQLPLLIKKAIDSNKVIRDIIANNDQIIYNNINELSKKASLSLLNISTNYTTIYKTAVGVIQLFASILSVLVMSIYMLIDKEKNTKAFVEMFPKKYHQKGKSIIDAVEEKLGQWVQAQFILSVIVFLLNYLILSFVLRIRFGLTIALIAGFLEVIPVAGPVIAAVIAFIITLLVNPGMVIYVLITSLLIHQLEAHILVPKIMQRVIGLSPLITIIALLIGADLVGVIGAILSVPIATILQIIYIQTRHD